MPISTLGAGQKMGIFVKSKTEIAKVHCRLSREIFFFFFSEYQVAPFYVERVKAKVFVFFPDFWEHKSYF